MHEEAVYLTRRRAVHMPIARLVPSFGSWLSQIFNGGWDALRVRGWWERVESSTLCRVPNADRIKRQTTPSGPPES